jgi:hypothetical protein
MKHFFSLLSAALGAAALLASAYVSAQTPNVKVIGVTFIEAPPARDKNLVPFGAGFGQEKVEVHAVLSIKDRLLIDLQGTGSDQAITASGTLPNKSVVALGSAKIGSFPKASADRKFMSISMEIDRLPDTVPIAATFSGSINVRVAKGTIQKSAKLSTQPGSTLDLGLGDSKVVKLEANTLKIAGGPGMERIASLRFTGNDGRAVTSERAGYMRMNERYEIEYKFAAPISDGKIEATLYDGMETVVVPIQITVTRPY